MSIYTECDFCRWDNFLDGRFDDIFLKSTFHKKSQSKKYPIEVSDLIITADTETSKYCVGVDNEFYEAAEVSYLKGLKIKVPERLKRCFNDYEYYRRKAFKNKLYLGSKGLDVEELYDELRRLYGWDDTLLTPEDKLTDIIEFLDDERLKKLDFTAHEDFYVGWIYQWSICVYGKRPLFIYGRKPSEMCACFKYIADILNLDENRRASIYFHNYSYDHQYLKKFISDSIDVGAAVDDDFRMLATAPHKIISYQTNCGITFKCSYRLSNASLDFWSKKVLFTRHKKLVGAVDYDVVRYQDTPLTAADWKYMFYDVLVTAECIEKALISEGDTLASIPLTSTGYVRRDARKNARKDKNAYKEFIKARLGVRSYKVLKSAQAGGYTHTNRFIAGETVKAGDKWWIGHRDKRSFYPSEQVCRKYPISKFICYAKNVNEDKWRYFLNDKDHHYLFVVSFKDAILKDGEIFPILSASKANKGRVDTLKMIEDNGRILSCKGRFVLSLTELDFKMILKQYVFDNINVLEVWRAKSGYLPGWMRATIDKYYKDKANLKAKTKLFPDDLDAAAALEKSKNKLNGIYGMSSTDICRVSFYEAEDGSWKEKPLDVGKELDKYFNNRNNFMWLQWGVYCTSYARYGLLQEAYFIQEFKDKDLPLNRVLYTDTDSLFYCTNERLEKALNARNEKAEKEAIKHGWFITMEDGRKVSYNSFDDEKEIIIKFRALHSKCYAYVTNDDKLHCTIAGVSKKGRVKELGNIDNLKNGYKFIKSGGTMIKYTEEEITHADIDGHRIEYASAAVILQSKKTIKYKPFEYDDEVKYIDIS